MSNTEDYLDGLLNSMEGKTETAEPEAEPMEENIDSAEDMVLQENIEENPAEDGMMPEESTREEDDFLDAFEKEFLSGEDSDEFIRQFEEELARESMEEAAAETAESQELSTESADGILGNIFEDKAEELLEPDDDIMIDTMGDDFGAVMQSLESDTAGDALGENASFPEMSGDIFAGMNDDSLMGIGDESLTGMNDDSLMGIGDESLMGMNDDTLMGSESLMGMNDNALMGMGDEMAGADEEAGLMGEDQDLMDLLQADGDFSGIGDMLQTGDENEDFSDKEIDAFGDFSFGDIAEDLPAEENLEEEAEEESKSRKRKKREKKKKSDDEKESSSFIQKISQLLFGDEEDEMEKKEVEPVTVAPSIEELSDENLQILQALEGGMTMPEKTQPESAVESAEEEKARKKREKKEKAAQKKSEKKEKREAAKKAKAEKKAKKPKKVKKPKEPDNTPPLPKKPVILTFVMVASFLALVLLGTNLVGYSNSIENAQREYDLGNYELAYKEIAGMEMKEADMETYEKCRVMANASGEFSAYQSFMEANLYDMALDALIRTVGRCQKYQPEAELYGCVQEITRLKEQTIGALASFGLTEEQALELYALDDREVYSAEIYAQIELAGFGMD